MDVKEERTGWRDLALSRRHRQWGWDCPAIDIDFLLLEYNKGIPIALIEYKHENAMPLFPYHPSYKALQMLATKADIYFFGCRYAEDYSWFRVIPGNEKAASIIKSPQKFSEEEYVRFLYQLRGRRLDKI